MIQIAGMLTAPFITNIFSLQETNLNKSVVEIGLGGGSLDMALHGLKPQVIFVFDYVLSYTVFNGFTG